MRRLVKLEVDLRDLALTKRSLEVAISDETRDQRIQDLESIINEIDRIISTEYAQDGYFNLVVDTKQARILGRIAPILLQGVHYQLDKALN